MASGYHDGNHTPTLTAVSSADGKTPITVYADPSTHRILTSNTATTNGSALAQTTTNANVLTVAATADSSYWVSATALCTAFTSGTMQVQVAYTDSNNSARTANLQGYFTSGYGVNVSGTGAFECQPIQIRAKSGTNVVISTVGTFTLTYDIYATVMQVA